MRRGASLLITALLLSLLVIPMSIPPAASSNGVGWFEGWGHRKSHVVNPAYGAGANYQTKIIVNYGPGVDNGADVYCNGSCRPDFGDIRFTDDDGITPLDYWIENKKDSDKAVFWVELRDDLSSDNVTIYVYYGKSNAITASNGISTFIRWDDFEDGYALGDWPKSDRGWGLTGTDTAEHPYIWSKPNGSGYALEYREDGTGGPDVMKLINTWTQVSGVVVHVDFYWSNRTFQARFDIMDQDDASPEINSLSRGDYSWYQVWVNSSSQYNRYTPDIQIGNSTWYEYEFTCLPNSHSMIVNGTTYTGQVRASGDGYDYFSFYGHMDYPDKCYLDNFYVRKYVSPEPSHGIWGNEEVWLPGWSYRRSHVINPAYGAGTNYQIKIIVHYGLGVDSGADVYCGGNCRTDFGDIRFTDDDGITELDYWMEKKVDSDYGVFWVEVADDLSVDNTTINIYYGNIAATSTSNGTNTFIFFDDCEDTSGWTPANADEKPAIYELSSLYAYSGSHSIHIAGDHNGSDSYISKSITGFSRINKAIEFSVYMIDENPYFWMGENGSVRIFWGMSGPGYYYRMMWWTEEDYSGWCSLFPGGSILSMNTWHRLSARFLPGIQVNRSGTAAKLYVDDSYEGIYPVISEVAYLDEIRLLSGYYDDADAFWDAIAVRQYVDPEPTHGVWEKDLQDDQQDDEPGPQQWSDIVPLAVGIGMFAAVGLAFLLRFRSSRAEALMAEPVVEPEVVPTYEEKTIQEEPPSETGEAGTQRAIPLSESICPHCGHKNPAEARFCVRCGLHLSEPHS